MKQPLVANHLSGIYMLLKFKDGRQYQVQLMSQFKAERLKKTLDGIQEFGRYKAVISQSIMLEEKTLRMIFFENNEVKCYDLRFQSTNEVLNFSNDLKRSILKYGPKNSTSY